MVTARPSAKHATKSHVPADRNLKTHSHRQARVSVRASNMKFLELMTTSEILSEDPLLCGYV